jgi:hypothetical protein
MRLSVLVELCFVVVTVSVLTSRVNAGSVYFDDGIITVVRIGDDVDGVADAASSSLPSALGNNNTTGSNTTTNTNNKNATTIEPTLLVKHRSAFHNCIHDSVEVHALHNSSRAAVAAAIEARRVARGAAGASEADVDELDRPLHRRAAAAAATVPTGPIRFSVSSLDFDTAGQYCEYAGQVVTNLLGSYLTCEEDDVLTDAKRDFVRNLLLPRAIERIQGYLSVAQRHSASYPLVVASQGVCGGFTIPASPDTTTGFTDADMRLYVAAAPTTSGIAAWAAACQDDAFIAFPGATQRYVVARINWSPRELSVTDRDDDNLETQVMRTVHELTHALGFSFTRLYQFSVVRTLSIRGKNYIWGVDAPAVLARARDHFGCDTYPAVELEDEGSSGSANSHWDRRILPEDTMAPVSAARYSVMTMAVMEALGYVPNYTAAAPLLSGRRHGCDYLYQQCNETVSWSRLQSSDVLTASAADQLVARVVDGAATSPEFCFDSSNSAQSAVCTPDLTGYGPCTTYRYSATLPTYFRYFSDPTIGGQSFTDGCPRAVEYGNRGCMTNSLPQNDQVRQQLSFYQSASSRCYTSKGVVGSGWTVGDDALRGVCMQSRCVNGVVHFRTGYSSDATLVDEETSPTIQGRGIVNVANAAWMGAETADDADWVACPYRGYRMTALRGFDGSIECPDPVLMCASLQSAGTTATSAYHFSAIAYKTDAARIYTESAVIPLNATSIDTLLSSIDFSASPIPIATTSGDGHVPVASSYDYKLQLHISGSAWGHILADATLSPLLAVNEGAEVLLTSAEVVAAEQEAASFGGTADTVIGGGASAFVTRAAVRRALQLDIAGFLQIRSPGVCLAAVC